MSTEKNLQKQMAAAGISGRDINVANAEDAAMDELQAVVGDFNHVALLAYLRTAGEHGTIPDKVTKVMYFDSLVHALLKQEWSPSDIHLLANVAIKKWVEPLTDADLETLKVEDG